jgi:cytoskeletal protein RodZ
MAELDPPPPGTVSGAGSFGDELRREREIRGISLKEIADSTKISKRFLEAIERNDFKNLPAPVFTRGFIREYARYLGLNADEMINHYMQFMKLYEAEEEQKTGPIPLPPHRLTTSRIKTIPRARIDGNLVLFIVFLIALVGIGAWAFRYHHTENLAPEKTATKEAEASRMPLKPAAAVPSTESAEVIDPTGLHLTVELLGNSWIALQADGKTVLNDEIRKGEKRSFDAQNEFRFKTIGNAAGVALTLNGVKLPPLGSDGEVIHDRVLDRATVEKAPATPPRT